MYFNKLNRYFCCKVYSVMEMLQLVLFGILASFIYIVFKELQPSIALFIIIISSVIIFLVVVQKISIIIYVIKDLSVRASIPSIYMQTLLKIIGIAYITEIGANIVKDAGMNALASKIELAGKLFILLLAIPIIKAVIETMIQFVPN